MQRVIEAFRRAVLERLCEDAFAGAIKDFDKFSRNYILSGESNLAYGYGFYFALDPDVALRYQKKSTAQRTLKVNGIPIKNFHYSGNFDWNGVHYDGQDLIDVINNDAFRNITESKYFFNLIFFNIVHCLTKGREIYIPDCDNRDGENPDLIISKPEGSCCITFWGGYIFGGGCECNYSIDKLQDGLKNQKLFIAQELEKSEREFEDIKSSEYDEYYEDNVRNSYDRCVNLQFHFDCINAAIEILNDNKFEIDSGVTKKVKIPDNEFLLIGDKRYSEQSSFVQKALDKMYQRFGVEGLSLRFFLPDIKNVSLTELKGFAILTIDPDADVFEPYSSAEIFDEEMVNELFDKYEMDILIKYFNQDNKNTKISKEILFKELLNAKIKPFPGDYKERKGYGLLKFLTNKINFYYRLTKKHDKNYAKRVVSQLFHSVGIKGFQYVGTVDGKCVVIFDPDDIEIIKSFYDRNLISLKPLINEES